jgi:hypothetical protein
MIDVVKGSKKLKKNKAQKSVMSFEKSKKILLMVAGMVEVQVNLLTPNCPSSLN